MTTTGEFPLILDGHEDFLTQISGYQNLPGRGDSADSEPSRRDFL